MHIECFDRHVQIPTLYKLLQFSNKEFDTFMAKNPARYPQDIANPNTSSIVHWQMLLKDKQGRIYTAFGLDNDVLGIVFCYAKVPLSTHIWLAITAEEHRKKGVMRALFREVEKRERERGSQSLTVNTIPEVFAEMPQFLESSGFVALDDEYLGEKGRTRKARYGKELQYYSN